ncbi:hypothetical protein HYQ43_08635 [Paracoccus pantotrophus]|uniref:Uncharacterized protein n=1 Tax=Paracoccus pantotrophus TaxID=82367 RepID=A0A7H9BX30_PARPN|nr:hypothetical protein [Paracoccus pantotrophus]QLH14381.1 hypothetical protein HYQ43_08635 [Paracoccus pantotrophus]
MIERDHPALSIVAQCRLLSISRSSFYHEPAGETERNLGLMRKRRLRPIGFSLAVGIARRIRLPLSPL